MNKQNYQQSKEFVYNTKNILIIFVSITTLFSSGIVFTWQISKNKSAGQYYPQQITYLQNKINNLQQLQANQNNANDSYNLDCVDKPDDFQSKYAWYKHFKEQIIDGWELDTVCFNKELNKAVYLKSKIDLTNYKYDYNRESYGFSQLGIYDIVKNEYDKATIKYLGFYEGCGTIKQWIKNNLIFYRCSSGDAGFLSTNTYSYNVKTKDVQLIQSCNIEANRDPEEICE